MIAIKNREGELKKFIEMAVDESLSTDARNYLVRLGAVLICGYVERSIEVIITTRLQRRAHQRVLNFVKSHFKRGRNMDCEEIGQLLSRFDPTWYRNFIDYVGHNPDVKEGIASCYAIRNSVAHGGAASLGPQRLNELLEVTTKLIGAVAHATE